MNRHPVPPATVTLRVLATTDLHMHLMAYDYYADRPHHGQGLVRTASLIRQQRADAIAKGYSCLLFDNGDTLQGTATADMITRRQDTALHPMIDAMNHLQYDAATLGNHDFDYGLDALSRACKNASFPFVISNITGAIPSNTAHHMLLDRTVTDTVGQTHSLKIGLIGLVPPQTGDWHRHTLLGKVEFQDYLPAAAAAVSSLRAAGADMVIALAHSGVGIAGTSHITENAAVQIAGLDGIDAIVTGHTHLRLPGPHHTGISDVDPVRGAISGKPAIMAGAYGSHLGQIDLKIQSDPSGQWRVVGHTSDVLPIAWRDNTGTLQPLVQDDPQIAARLTQTHHETRHYCLEPVGQSPHALHSFFAHAADSPALRFVAEAQAHAVLAQLGDGSGTSLPVLSAVCPLKSGGLAGPDDFTDIPSGELCLRHIADLQVFPNMVTVVETDGAHLREWLEMSASLFRSVIPNAPRQLLLNPDMPGYQFDVIYGLTYQIDLTQDARYHPDGRLKNPLSRRIVNLSRNGTQVADSQRFVVVLNNYRASGGGNFPGFETATRVDCTALSVRDALHEHLAIERPALFSAPAPWQFVPTQGAQAVLRTSPAAIAHLGDIAHLEPRVLGQTSDGYLEIALHF